MNKYLATATAKLIAALVLALAIVAFILWLKWDDAAQPKQDARSANATAETAKEVAETVIERASDDATVDQLVEETAKEILLWAYYWKGNLPLISNTGMMQHKLLIYPLKTI